MKNQTALLKIEIEAIENGQLELFEALVSCFDVYEYFFSFQYNKKKAKKREWKIFNLPLPNAAHEYFDLAAQFPPNSEMLRSFPASLFDQDNKAGKIKLTEQNDKNEKFFELGILDQLFAVKYAAAASGDKRLYNSTLKVMEFVWSELVATYIFQHQKKTAKKTGAKLKTDETYFRIFCVLLIFAIQKRGGEGAKFVVAQKTFVEILMQAETESLKHVKVLSGTVQNECKIENYLKLKKEILKIRSRKKLMDIASHALDSFLDGLPLSCGNLAELVFDTVLGEIELKLLAK